MERPSYPCKFVCRDEVWHQSRHNVEELFCFGDRVVNDLCYVCGIILEVKSSTLSDMADCVSLVIRDCSIDANCTDYNCLGDANVRGVDRLIGTNTLKAVTVFVERTTTANETDFSRAMFASGEFRPQHGDVVFLFGKVGYLHV